jgi:hypothetical protein
LDRDCPESSDSVSECGRNSPCRDISNAADNGTSNESSFQFQHIIEFDPSSRDHSISKPAIKKKMVCECGAVILVRTEWKHKQSNKHIQFMLWKRTQQEQHQEHNSLPAQLQQRSLQQKQKKNRYRPRPVYENRGAGVVGPPATLEAPRERQPELQLSFQQQLLPQWSDDRTKPLFQEQTHATQHPSEQQSDPTVPTIFTKESSRNPQLPAWSSYGRIGLEQQSIFRTSSDITGTGIGKMLGLVPQNIWIDHFAMLDSSGGGYPVFQSQARLEESRISGLRQQQQLQPLWYIATPPGPVLEEHPQWQWQWQSYRGPMAPETGLFDRDYSASLSNFPIGSSN